MMAEFKMAMAMAVKTNFKIDFFSEKNFFLTKITTFVPPFLFLKIQNGEFFLQII
jgi:hypothetical protein